MAHRARSPQERREAAEARRARRASVTEPEAVMEAAAAFLAVRSRSVDETRTSGDSTFIECSVTVRGVRRIPH